MMEKNHGNRIGPEVMEMGATDEYSESRVDKTGLQRLLPSELQIRFADKHVEQFFVRYSVQQKRNAIYVLVLLFIFFNLTQLIFGIVKDDNRMLVMACVSLGINLIVLILFLVNTMKRLLSDSVYPYVIFLYWCYCVVNVFVHLAVNFYPKSPSDNLGWVLVLSYITYIVIPIRLGLCIASSVLLCVLHIVITAVLANKQDNNTPYIGLQVSSSILLYLCSNILGVISYIIVEKRQRRSFLEMRQSLSITVILEEKSQENERLLLSVLPKHVAKEMVDDFGAEFTGAFRKIYMSRYENVSILFADIVGFTALSSGCTAAELVQVLNDLFARFDQLAMKYHQLRIKILGDCYYCICGAPPNIRDDHAALCIHMGLNIIDAIKEVRKLYPETGVDMRVGIHTGGVLAGVVGLKQWQFDVLGKEVTFANKMESGGLPGRVHVSSTTTNFLNGQFELEPGYGEEREEAIKTSGIATYVIKSVLEPYPQGTNDMHGANNIDIIEENNESSSGPNSNNSNIEGNERLYRALKKHDMNTNVYRKMNPVTLIFNEKAMENTFSSLRDKSSGFVFIGYCLIVLLSSLAQICILPRTVTSVVTFVIGEIGLIIMTAILLASAFPKRFPEKIVNFNLWMDKKYIFRIIWTSIAVLFISVPDIVDVAMCEISPSYNQTGKVNLQPTGKGCEYPLYFGDMCVVVLIAVVVLLQVGYIVKSVMLIIIAIVHCTIYNVLTQTIFDRFDTFMYASNSSHRGMNPTRYSTVGLIVSVTLVGMLCSRYIEEMMRKLFIWRYEVEDQKDQISVQTKKNESLILNILPKHVAMAFIGNDRNDGELYSQTHDEVGVIFASCPNFNDYYTEEAVNNNGLDWIRFLNEVISDYDELLNEPRFQSIIKIKTIGPTYMAASGISRTEEITKDAPITERWKHLSDLVRFAFALRNQLDTINKQSFNCFVLRIGINHGPIISGVIGAKKPHFDIWGNTVNVASRMDGTGKGGEIQVTEETMELLKHFGFIFEKRGLVKVKGKGELITYFLKALPPTDLNLLRKPAAIPMSANVTEL